MPDCPLKSASGSCELDLDPMTLIYDLDLDILKMCFHTISRVFWSRLSKS